MSRNRPFRGFQSAGSRIWRWVAVLEAIMRALRFAFLLLTVVALPIWGARIYVTTDEDKISSDGGCSVKEAIYAAVLHEATADGIHSKAITGYDPTTHEPQKIDTQCLVGDGNDDTIVLPSNHTLPLSKITDDADNFMGPTATPMITTRITIEGNGATLQHDSGSPNLRLFAVGHTGHLTLKFATVKDFKIKGGDGGHGGGGGGGMGAGGAIYVAGPGTVPGGGGLDIESCTFAGNQAVGGTGSGRTINGNSSGSGGGGVSGNGGGASSPAVDFAGGGGGGSRGNGGASFADSNNHGGAGGGTVTDGVGRIAGFSGGGGNGTDNGGDGGPGGGGGGGGYCNCHGGKGGDGGGGGGGGPQGGDGANGGFGGGGGGSDRHGGLFGVSGGNGGFGGGAGAGASGSISGGGAGRAGLNGGWANDFNGGGGAALGGAIFNDEGDVTMQNSTFFGNSVYRGDGGGVGTSDSPGGNGADLGAAIYSFHGRLVIRHSTISSNLSTGPLGGVILDNRDLPCDGGLGSACLGLPSGTFTIENTIIAHNGGDLSSSRECSILGDIPAALVTGSGNLIMQNDTGAGSCPGHDTRQEDPQLGPLQNNLGLTPTMAIPHDSPARATAVGGLEFEFPELAFDQRGQRRPSKDGHGYDIGAFELCESDVPFQCEIPRFTEGTPRKLITQASPLAGGITSPAPGMYLETTDSVVILNAVPNFGYYFLSWIGGVANSPTSASNAVIMDQDRTITANFQLHDFSLSASPTTLTIPLGGSGQSTATVTSRGNFADRVNLTASGEPAGVNVALNPKSVTPAPGTPALSILTVAVGSSVTPQTFTETVTGDSTGIAGALKHSSQVSVTVVATAAAVVNVINQDQTLGCVDNSGVGKSLIAKINAYNLLSSGGQILGATNVLAAFQYEVQAQTGQHIATTCTDPVGGNQFYTGQTLITDAQSLQATLGKQVNANPIVGSVVNFANTGISGATVNLLSSLKTVVATATTDAVGFYYFAGTSGLTPGATYTVKVTLPKAYKSSTPSAQSLTWSATPVKLASFALN